MSVSVRVSVSACACVCVCGGGISNYFVTRSMVHNIRQKQIVFRSEHSPLIE